MLNNLFLFPVLEKGKIIIRIIHNITSSEKESAPSSKLIFV